MALEDTQTSAQLSWFDRVLASPGDPESLRLQKRVLLASALMMSLGGVIWGLFLGHYGRLDAVGVPYGYTALTILNIGAYQLFRRYLVFRWVQLLLTLLLPLFLHVALGGFAASSAVVTWAILAPMGALLFTTRREAQLWGLAFLGVLLVGAAVEPTAAAPSGLPRAATLVFYCMNLSFPLLAAFLIIDYFVREKDTTMSLLDGERQETERLLLNVLPREIAELLRGKKRADEGGTIARNFDSISVLFADIVGFTGLSARLSPKEMVETLNEIFSHFDTLVERYGVEKIRTIGDNYMVASGVPTPRDDHAEALVAMALDMKAYLDERQHGDAVQLNFRIGINSGPAVGGVVGQTKFHYDVWGDAVNVASRMESHGIPGRVQIGASTRALVGNRFVCEPRGTIEIKGKGTMETWFVEGRADAAGSSDGAHLVS